MMTNLDTQMGTAAGTVTATMADGGKKASKAFGNGEGHAIIYRFIISNALHHITTLHKSR